MRMKKILVFFLVLVMLFCSIPLTAFAASTNPMDNTNVMNDLKSMGIDVTQYSQDASADYVSVIQFQEYGYHHTGDVRYYGLYLYLYNPTGEPINVNSAKLQLAYVPGGHSSGHYGTYAKYGLECISASLQTGYEHLFYKFKVSLSSQIGRTISDGIREYRLSGIEFKNEDGNYVENPLSYEINYTGFQENFGPVDGAKSTLYACVDSFETIQTKLHAASWLSKTSDLGKDYRYEVSSVYFNIPDWAIKKYGNIADKPENGGTSGLYSVKGTYDKYVTNGLVVPDQTTYDWIAPLVGKDLTKVSGYQNGSTGTNGCFYSLDWNVAPVANSFNLQWRGMFSTPANVINTLCFLMVDSDKNVSQNEFEDIYRSTKNDSSLIRKYLSLNEGQFVNGEAVFENLGVNLNYEITVEQGSLNNAIKSWSSGQDFVWLAKLFTGELFTGGEKYAEIKPIVELNPSDFTNYTDEAISEHYFVTLEDAKDMATFVNDYKSKNHLYLMRLDVNPYYAQDVIVIDNTKSPKLDFSEGNYFEKVVYENVDVLEFTFRDKHGGESIVAVNCDPIDIVGSVVRPGEADPNNPTKADVPDGDFDWTDLELWIKLLLVVALIFAVIFVLRLVGVSIGALFKGLGKLITAPFRLIGKALDKSKKKKPKKDKPEKKSKKDKPKEKKSDVAKPKKTYVAPEATPYVENPDEKKPYKRPRATLLRPKKK